MLRVHLCFRVQSGEHDEIVSLEELNDKRLSGKDVAHWNHAANHLHALWHGISRRLHSVVCVHVVDVGTVSIARRQQKQKQL